MKTRNLRTPLLSLVATLVACASSADEWLIGPPPGERLSADVLPVTTGNWYRPGAAVAWQWQLDGAINTSYSVDLYDVDLFDAPDAVLAVLRSRGHRIVCYFSAGTYEPDRPDSDRIPASARGKALPDWPNERWLDVRDMRIFDIMVARLDVAVGRGCDAVEPDNVDGHTNDTGFSLRATDLLAFNRNLANAAHRRGLGIALKNAGQQAAELVDYYDFELNEECHAYEECDDLRPFLDHGKPVLNAEYAGTVAAAQQLATTLCPRARAAGMRTLILPSDLDDRFRISCF